mmetsp:Transcript_88361/g.210970  ORF Transcript_88361/g.210970 Transcript_88361/m.210970 type:complete len:261 (+) Transcript_88361:341-1123(+)
MVCSEKAQVPVGVGSLHPRYNVLPQQQPQLSNLRICEGHSLIQAAGQHRGHRRAPLARPLAGPVPGGVRADDLTGVSAWRRLFHSILILGRLLPVIIAGGPAGIPREVALSLALSQRALSTAANGVFRVPIRVVPVASSIINLIIPAAALLVVPPAPASAPAPPPASAPASLCVWSCLLHRLLRRRLPAAVPHPRMDSLPQLPPKPHLREGLHDLRPAASHTVIESLCLRHGSPVQQAQKLCSEALRRAIVCCPDWHAGV